MIIIGAGGHARVVIETALLNNYEVLGVIDHQYLGYQESIIGIPVIGGLSELKKYDPKDTSVFIALGEGRERETYFNMGSKEGYELPSLIHPTATIGSHVNIGQGVLINSGAIINTGVSLGEGAIVNTGAIIDHESEIGKYAHVGPGSKIAGRVTVGEYTFIGIGAIIIDKISVGFGCRIGAGAVLINDIPSDSTVVGIPARSTQ